MGDGNGGVMAGQWRIHGWTVADSWQSCHALAMATEVLKAPAIVRKAKSQKSVGMPNIPTDSRCPKPYKPD